MLHHRTLRDYSSGVPWRYAPRHECQLPNNRGLRRPRASLAFSLQPNLGIIMRIAQVSPLFESVPPKSYGGTERVVSYLTEELVKRGHRVTLFATADSETSAQLVPICDRALRLNRTVTDSLAYHYLALEA